jgi:hypothetical protein
LEDPFEQNLIDDPFPNNQYFINNVKTFNTGKGPLQDPDLNFSKIRSPSFNPRTLTRKFKKIRKQAFQRFELQQQDPLMMDYLENDFEMY